MSNNVLIKMCQMKKILVKASTVHTLKAQDRSGRAIETLNEWMIDFVKILKNDI